MNTKHNSYFNIFNVFIIIMILSSCSKEKKIAKQLDGNWTVASVRITANGQSLQSLETINSLTFEKCKTSKETSCSGSAGLANGSSEAMKWTLRNDELSLASTNANDEIYWWSGRWLVQENSKSKMVLFSDDCLNCQTLNGEYTVVLTK